MPRTGSQSSSSDTALAASTYSISYCVSLSPGRTASLMALSLLELHGGALLSPCSSWPQVRNLFILGWGQGGMKQITELAVTPALSRAAQG